MYLKKFTFKIRSKCALFFTDKCYTIRQSVPCRPPKLSSSCVHAVDVLHSLAKCFYTHGSKDFLICGVRYSQLTATTIAASVFIFVAETLFYVMKRLHSSYVVNSIVWPNRLEKISIQGVPSQYNLWDLENILLCKNHTS